MNDAYTPSDEDRATIVRHGTPVETTLIQRIDGHADVFLQDGHTSAMTGLFTQPRTLLASPVTEQLSSTLENGPTGRFIKVDEGKATNVPNVSACGDAARATGNLTLAAVDGAMA